MPCEKERGTPRKWQTLWQYSTVPTKSSSTTWWWATTSSGPKSSRARSSEATLSLPPESETMTRVGSLGTSFKSAGSSNRGGSSSFVIGTPLFHPGNERPGGWKHIRGGKRAKDLRKRGFQLLHYLRIEGDPHALNCHLFPGNQGVRIVLVFTRQPALKCLLRPHADCIHISLFPHDAQRDQHVGGLGFIGCNGGK